MAQASDLLRPVYEVRPLAIELCELGQATEFCLCNEYKYNAPRTGCGGR